MPGLFRWRTKTFDESKHPRGQPENAGQFAETPSKGTKERPGRTEHRPHLHAGAARHTRIPTVYPVGQKPPQRGRIPTVYPVGQKPPRRERIPTVYPVGQGPPAKKPKGQSPQSGLWDRMFPSGSAAEQRSTKQPPQQKPKNSQTRDFYHGQVTQYFADALAAATHLSDRQRHDYQSAADAVLAMMPERALLELSQNINQIEFFSDVYALTAEVSKRDPGVQARLESFKAKQGITGDIIINGLCSGDGGSLMLDGKTAQGRDIAGHEIRYNVQEVYAHELTHSIDGGRQYSNDGQWQSAWSEEIAKGGLSDYAATSAVEGFAELGRLAYGTAIDRKLVEQKFPKCVAFWKKAGLWE